MLKILQSSGTTLVARMDWKMVDKPAATFSHFFPQQPGIHLIWLILLNFHIFYILIVLNYNVNINSLILKTVTEYLFETYICPI